MSPKRNLEQLALKDAKRPKSKAKAKAKASAPSAEEVPDDETPVLVGERKEAISRTAENKHISNFIATCQKEVLDPAVNMARKKALEELFWLLSIHSIFAFCFENKVFACSYSGISHSSSVRPQEERDLGSL